MKLILTKLFTLVLLFSVVMPNSLDAQKKRRKGKKAKTEKTDKKEEKVSYTGLKFRCVGPAVTSGRISDFAINPDKPHEYYVATSSGGVWKTINSGTTYKPIFDGQGSYSIGCVTMDPSNSNTIWVGTGENNNQRSVAYGDGIYKSNDGGTSWEHMGLKESEHIGNIIVHPDNSDVVWVSAIGPLWSKGGDRGVYKTTDGGKTWKAVLEIDEHTGVTDLIIDPRNPMVLYAAAFQRRRHVFTYLGGGPASGIYKSVDGGETWNKANKGLPKVDIGRIGLAISPADPETLYAIVEASQGKSGTYRSTNKGVSWHKRGSYVTSGNYYQEIVPDPINKDVLYSMNTWLTASKDGGKSFNRVGENTKHVDNHCMWINPENTQHWLLGCDGGIYETWDAAKTWNFKSNLPVTQFYKVSVDNDYPFYNIFGGTQDNFSLGGPSRTNTSHGIMNSDWFITHGGDGFETQIDPENPNIIYAQSQYGVLVRYDKLSGEEVGIQPKERKGENSYRWNWDAPLATSHHVSGRLYFAANKVFRSDDYGNSWNVISDDLTRQLNRNELKVMDRLWGVDAVAKNRSTSPYGTIVAFSESPINKDLIFAGTDDGLIQISDNGGETWKKIDNIGGAPTRSYVNAIYTSHHDENVVYAAFNHHKYGDFKPYIFKSSDRGNTWQKISNDLPERGSIYSIEEDHVDKNLIFCGTEFGVFFSNNGGGNWHRLKAGVPTIAVRDVAIQRRENDLVLGTFGRGFYVLDDYTPLRSLKADKSNIIYPVRDALLYEKASPLGLPGKSFQGDNFYTGENLGPVALISYYLGEDKKTLEEERRKKEKEAAKENNAKGFPTYDELSAEKNQIKPEILFTIKDVSGNVVKKITKKAKKGMGRFEWDLRYSPKSPIRLSKPSFYNPFAGKSEGTLVTPGTYSVSMSSLYDGEVSELAGPISFEVKALDNAVMPADNREAKVAFQREVTELSRSIEGAQHLIREMDNKLKHLKKAIRIVEQPMKALYQEANEIEMELKKLKIAMNGDGVKTKLDIDQPPTPASRVGWITYEQKYSTASPTETHKNTLAIAKEEFEPILKALQKLAGERIEELERKLEEADAPYTPGRAIKMMN